MPGRSFSGALRVNIWAILLYHDLKGKNYRAVKLRRGVNMTSEAVCLLPRTLMRGWGLILSEGSQIWGHEATKIRGNCSGNTLFYWQMLQSVAIYVWDYWHYFKGTRTEGWGWGLYYINDLRRDGSHEMNTQHPCIMRGSLCFISMSERQYVRTFYGKLYY